MNRDNLYRWGAVLWGMLIVALIAAKFIGHLHLAWWIVLIPVWGPIVGMIIVALIVIVCFAGAESRGENPFQ